MRKAGLSRQALRVSESLVKPDAAESLHLLHLGVGVVLPKRKVQGGPRIHL